MENLAQFFLRVALVSFLAISTIAAQAQTDSLRNQIKQLEQLAKGKVYMAYALIEDHDTLSYNGNAHAVMQSVMKLPIAMAVLHQVDVGQLKLTQTIHITKADLPETFSPLRDKYPDGNVDVSIADLLSYMVTLSDNDACDILLKLLGGTKPVEQYIHQLGFKQFSLKASERQMGSSWAAQYTNWCRPVDMVQLLCIVDKGTALSEASNGYLWQLMLATVPGAKRIKGMLPAGTPVAHRTGTGATNTKGFIAAINDVGIIMLPNGKHLALAVFVNDTYMNNTQCEKVIARISKAVYDYAMSK
ncbi:class A beta-lactamase [Mucilaginibacter robiniae]|uniref:beta-lactamase n=1 Tax=Mucilaginibacter robiniae TaxID=2728022 RepID=A0A7L5DWP1_9SPHI|nr:class A beta-lactamase [Mucilaginibacter robiniae]QJD94497.1 class A beta-lactamase [Mucilaginibacter robiniae]